MVSIENVANDLVIYGYLVVLVFGTFGSLFNIMTFSSKTFRKNACTFYLICSALMELIALNFGIIARLSTEYFGNHSINSNSGVCKVRSYFPVCLPIMASTCVSLAAFDRCMSTSQNTRWRQLSSITIARYLCATIMFIDLVSGIFLLFIFDIRNGTCAVQPGLQPIIVSVYTVVFILIIPHGGMLIFCIQTLIHVKQSRNRIGTVYNSEGQHHSVQRTNRQLLIITIIHASISTILVTIRFCAYSYNVLTSSVKKSVEQQKIEYMIQQVSIIILYINYSMAFYIYYGSSPLFRKNFHTSFKWLINKCVSLCGLESCMSMIFDTRTKPDNFVETRTRLDPTQLNPQPIRIDAVECAPDPQHST